MNDLKDLYEKLIGKEVSIEQVNESQVIINIQHDLENFKRELSVKSRTAKLWIQYVDYISIIKMFIRAERTGNWNMHLNAAQKMLNLFAATGHMNYAKSTRLYLQLMFNMHIDHPWLYEQYSKLGFHSVRRSDRFWAGLWPDLVIEQCMMRTVKSRGGLTHGRGMSESTRDLWVRTMHKCAAVHENNEPINR